MEIWKEVANGNGKYEVSNLGNVRRKETLELINQKIGRSGYYQCKAGSKESFSHRNVAKAFIPNPNNLKQVNHINGNKLDNRADNLEWVSGKENMRHAVENELLGQMKRVRVYHKYNGYLETLKSITEVTIKYKLSPITVTNSCKRLELVGEFMFQFEEGNKAEYNDGVINFKKINNKYNKILEFNLDYSNKIVYNSPDEYYNKLGRVNNGHIEKVCKSTHFYKSKILYFEVDYEYDLKNNNLFKYKSKNRKVAQYSLDGEFIRTFESIEEAEKHFSKSGIATSSIRHVLSDKMKNETSYGFIWKEIK